LQGQEKDAETKRNQSTYVQFSGNSRTRDAYLSRFIKSNKGETSDSIVLAEDLRRLRTLPGILSADVAVNQSDTGRILEFVVEERWTLLPVGDFGVSDDSYWIGAGAMEYNAFGQGIYLYGYIQYKSPFALQAIIRYPYIFGSKIGIEYQTQYFEASENQQAVNYDGYKFAEHRLSGKYEIVYEKDILFGVAQSIEQVENDQEQIDEKKSVRILSEVRFRHLNYRYFVLDGWQNTFIFSYRMPYTQHRNSIDFYDELKLFKSYNRLNFACRFAYGLSTEEESFYMPYVVDNYKNFRGSGYRVYKGNQLVMLNLEGRFTVFENKIGGIQTLIFSDIGKISSWITLEDNHLNESLFFAGPGARLIFKKAYNAVLSIDYGINVSDFTQGGWVIGWGQYF
jgi:hypothetical protein